MNSSIIVRSATVALVLLIAACASDPKDGPPKPSQARSAAEERAAADKLYRSAREALDNGDMTTALTHYDKLSQQFPFSEFATQGDLERVYALYRNYQPDQALSAADKFVREHPRHPGAAYAQYLKGLVNSTRDEGLAGFVGLDTTKEDVGYLRNAFDDFAVLVRKYPKSPYVGDARQRMIDLRNRVAQHEMHIVRFYVKRGAYVAAAKRAEQVVTQYPGAPASLEALKLLQESYRALNLLQQADDAKRLYAALAQKQGENDYPGFGNVESLPQSFKDSTPTRVVPVEGKAEVEDSSWLQSLLAVFGDKSETPTQAPAPANATAAQPETAPAATAADEKDASEINLVDVLKSTFGRNTAAPAKTHDNAPLTTEPAKAQPANNAEAVRVVPAAPQDDSFLGKLKQLMSRERTEEDLAPGGRAKADKTPLFKETLPPPAADRSSNELPSPPLSAPTGAEEPSVPASAEEDSWFSKIANFFGASSTQGNLATGGRPEVSKEPLIKEAPAPAAAQSTVAAEPAPPLAGSAPVVRKVTPQKKGNWFTRLFSFFDTSESEPYTVVIPTNSSPAPAAPADGSAEPAKSSSKMTIEMEPYDDGSAKKPATDSAQPATSP